MSTYIQETARALVVLACLLIFLALCYSFSWSW